MSTQQSLTVSLKFSRLLLPWLLASGLGWCLGVWLAGLLVPMLRNVLPFDSLNNLSLSSMTLAFTRGILMGISIGTFQWMTMRASINRGGLWIIASGLGWALAHMAGSWAEWEVFGMSPTSQDIEVVAGIASYITIGVSAGVTVGTLQWSLLKNSLHNPMSWIWTSTLAWSTPLLTYAAFVYLAILIPMNDGFIGFRGTSSGSLVALANLTGSFLYYGIGIMAGAISGRALFLQPKSLQNSA